MKIFLALVFIVVAIISIIRGTVFKGSINKIKSLAQDFHDNYYDRENEVYAKNVLIAAIPMVFGSVFLVILELLFYISVVNIVQLTIPTILMMLLLILSFTYGALKMNKNNVKITSGSVLDKIKTEKNAAKRLMNMKTRTTTNTVLKFISLAYFVFALLVLISL